MTWLTERELAAAVCPDADRGDGGEQVTGEHEIVPGVVVERRSVFQISALAAAALLFGRTPTAATAGDATRGQEEDNDQLTWNEFLERCVPLAEPLYRRKSPQGQDAYLFSVAAQAALLEDVPIGNMRRFRQFEPSYEFELAHRGFPFIVIHWRMEPHAVLPAHCHPGTSVCTLGLDGETLVRHFEPIGEAPRYNQPEQRPFSIRETRNQLISTGRVSTLSATRDNIHYFVAGPEGARGIDITTHYDSDGSFSFLHFDPDRPTNAGRREYEARWVGSDLQTNF